MAKPRRWVIYAAQDDKRLDSFAKAVIRAGAQWKPLVVGPLKLDQAIKVLQPEAVVVATGQPRDESFLRRTFALHGRRRLIFDDRQFPAISKLLRSVPPRVI